MTGVFASALELCCVYSSFLDENGQDTCAYRRVVVPLGESFCCSFQPVAFARRAWYNRNGVVQRVVCGLLVCLLSFILFGRGVNQ